MRKSAALTTASDACKSNISSSFRTTFSTISRSASSRSASSRWCRAACCRSRCSYSTRTGGAGRERARGKRGCSPFECPKLRRMRGAAGQKKRAPLLSSWPRPQRRPQRCSFPPRPSPARPPHCRVGCCWRYWGSFAGRHSGLKPPAAADTVAAAGAEAAGEASADKSTLPLLPLLLPP